MKNVLMAGLVLTYASWVALYRFAFKTPQDGTLKLRVVPKRAAQLQLLSISVMLAQSTSLLRTTTLSKSRAATSFTGLAASLTLLAGSLRTTKGTKLSRIFEKEPSPQLLSTGPYALIRHPLYTSYSLGWIAGVAAAPNSLAIAALIPLHVLYVSAARDEERALLAQYPQQYADYRRRVPAFIPRLFQSRSNDVPSSTSSRVLQIAGALASIAAVFRGARFATALLTTFARLVLPARPF